MAGIITGWTATFCHGFCQHLLYYYTSSCLSWSISLFYHHCFCISCRHAEDAGVERQHYYGYMSTALVLPPSKKLGRSRRLTSQWLKTSCGLASPLVLLRISSAKPKLSATGTTALMMNMSVPSFISSCRTRPSLFPRTPYTRPAHKRTPSLGNSVNQFTRSRFSRGFFWRSQWIKR